MGKDIVIQVRDLSIAYDDTLALDKANIDFYENSITAIVGPNGAGKSTLLKGMMEIVKPIGGSVTIWNQTYKKVYQQIAYIPQFNNVNWNFPAVVEDVVLMGRYVHTGILRRYQKKDYQVVEEALKIVEMQDFSKRHISELSGGQKQRVFLARAIAQDAKIYLMDEPLQGVDVKTEAIIMDTIKGFQKEGKTILAVHHDLTSVEQYFDHVVFINQRVLYSGSVKEVFTQENITKTYQM